MIVTILTFALLASPLVDYYVPITPSYEPDGIVLDTTDYDTTVGQIDQTVPIIANFGFSTQQTSLIGPFLIASDSFEIECNPIPDNDPPVKVTLPAYSCEKVLRYNETMMLLGGSVQFRNKMFPSEAWITTTARSTAQLNMTTGINVMTDCDVVDETINQTIYTVMDESEQLNSTVDLDDLSDAVSDICGDSMDLKKNCPIAETIQNHNSLMTTLLHSASMIMDDIAGGVATVNYDPNITVPVDMLSVLNGFNALSLPENTFDAYASELTEISEDVEDWNNRLLIANATIANSTIETLDPLANMTIDPVPPIGNVSIESITVPSIPSLDDFMLNLTMLGTNATQVANAVSDLEDTLEEMVVSYQAGNMMPNQPVPHFYSSACNLGIDQPLQNEFAVAFNTLNTKPRACADNDFKYAEVDDVACYIELPQISAMFNSRAIIPYTINKMQQIAYSPNKYTSAPIDIDPMPDYFYNYQSRWPYQSQFDKYANENGYNHADLSHVRPYDDNLHVAQRKADPTVSQPLNNGYYGDAYDQIQGEPKDTIDIAFVHYNEFMSDLYDFHVSMFVRGHNLRADGETNNLAYYTYQVQTLTDSLDYTKQISYLEVKMACPGGLCFLVIGTLPVGETFDLRYVNNIGPFKHALGETGSAASSDYRLVCGGNLYSSYTTPLDDLMTPIF